MWVLWNRCDFRWERENSQWNCHEDGARFLVVRDRYEITGTRTWRYISRGGRYRCGERMTLSHRGKRNENRFVIHIRSLAAALVSAWFPRNRTRCRSHGSLREVHSIYLSLFRFERQAYSATHALTYVCTRAFRRQYYRLRNSICARRKSLLDPTHAAPAPQASSFEDAHCICNKVPPCCICMWK